MGRQRIHSTLGAWCLLILAQVAACGGDSGGSPIITAGGSAATGTSGTPAAATAGAVAPVAGTVAATAGTVAATAGTYSGNGATAGTAAAGTGAAGSGAVDTYMSCATADKTTPGPMLRAAASSAIITQMGTCSFSACHSMDGKRAKLVVDGTAGMDLHDLTVGKPSCESPNLQLVDASGGDAGLTKSWLWQKLVAPAGANDGILTAKPEWGTPVNCGQFAGQPFGLRMPDSNTSILLSPPSKLIAIRDWICAGAP